MTKPPAIIPNHVPQRFLFCAHRQIKGHADGGRAHLEICGVHPAERAFEVIDPQLLGRFWYFVYEVQTTYLLNLIRAKQAGDLPEDRLIVRGVLPKLDAILRTPEPVPVKPLHGIRIESMQDAYHTKRERRARTADLVERN